METEHGAWKLQCASVAGTRNSRASLPGGDHAVVDVCGDLLVLVDSDGCGTAARPADGARMVCEAFLAAVRAAGEAPPFATATDAHTWLTEVTQAAHQGVRHAAADLLDTPPDTLGYGELRQFHATLTAAVIREPWLLFACVGDGYAVVERDGRAHLASPPLRISEFENETAYFTGRDWERYLRLTVLHDPRVTGVLLTSDGLKSRLQSRPVRAPDGALSRPRILPDPELPRLLSAVRETTVPHERLCEYLRSPANLSEGDDVSLAMAVRRRGCPQ